MIREWDTLRMNAVSVDMLYKRGVAVLKMTVQL